MDISQQPTLDQEGVLEETHERFPFRGFGGRPSVCRLQIRWKDDTALAMWTELNDNSGTSVTNASESLAGEVVAEFNLEPSKCLFIEHYPPQRGISGPTWSIVSYEWEKGANDRWRARQAAWEALTERDAKKLLERFRGAPHA
jgi:hypothetical protein